jgi:hypothetical protein
VYRGKLNWENYAVNEGITIVFSTGFSLGQAVSVFWQWTLNRDGISNANASSTGIIDEISLDRKTIGFCFDQDYKFEGLIGPGFESLTLTMQNVSDGRSTTLKLTLNFVEPASSPMSHLIYMGKLDWFQYVRNELLIVVLSSSLDHGSAALNYWQCTIDSFAVEKSNQDFVVPLQVLEGGINGITNMEMLFGYYRFEVEIGETRDTLLLTMRNPPGHKSPTSTLRLTNGSISSKASLSSIITPRFDLLIYCFIQPSSE